MPTVQIRNVPEVVHLRLKSQAARSGQSLNEFLLARMTDIASVPTIPELVERIRGRVASTPGAPTRRSPTSPTCGSCATHTRPCDRASGRCATA